MWHYPGTTIAYWRHEVPLQDINMCLRAIPRLRAQESLVVAQRIAVGTGSMKKGAAGPILRQWKRDATGGQPRTRERKPANPATLAAMGIRVTHGAPEEPS
jgi:hypothetical protein